MAKKDVLKQFTALKGVGESKAQLLYENGYTSLEKLQNTSVEELTKIKGITEKSAKELLKQIPSTITAQQTVKKVSKQKTQPRKETTEKPTPSKESEEKPLPSAKPEETIEEKAEEYKVKKKPKLNKEQQQMLQIRNDLKERTPTFLREEWFRYKRIPKNWRRPDGITSKMRKNLKYRPSKVRVGFRGPKKTRHLHPSGFEEITIHTLDELDAINPDTQAVRIGGTVGTKKRLEILKKAQKKDIRILNMRG
jgi:large subunit ribosomal protein L32e